MIAFVLAIAVRWSSGGMRSSNTWAFVIGVVISLGIIALNLVPVTLLPAGQGPPNWYRDIVIMVFGFSAILAMVGLPFSLRGPDEADS